MEQVDVILGVDTHLEVHVGAVISQTGKLLGTLSVSARTSGYWTCSSRGSNPTPGSVTTIRTPSPSSRSILSQVSRQVRYHRLRTPFEHENGLGASSLSEEHPHAD
ncbi:hypothetical protein VSR73_30095 [Paraburkholderia ferrariae]|uniref:Transposase n=1 Tax=Paraburkholderia ferrariae TaxID=386056 RepID=A0ABU9RYY9_9BURK